MINQTIPREVEALIHAPNFDPKVCGHIQSWNEPEFLNFLNMNSRKVASKLRSALGDIEHQRDIGVELFVARILAIKRCSLIYEPNPNGKGPDFSVEYNSERFFCEATRIHESETLPTPPGHNGIIEMEFSSKQYKIIGDRICGKLLQTEAGYPNVVYMRSNRFMMQAFDFEKAFNSLSEQLNSQTDEFFQHHGYRDADEFREHDSHCSAVIFDDSWTDSDVGESTARIYVNKDAAYKLSKELLIMLHDAFNVPFSK